MDRIKAAEIEKHLLDAVDAIDRARKVADGLDKGDRETFAIPLGEIVSVLHFEVLQAVYARYPELAPPGEIPVISSLPESVSEADIDQIIFSVLSMQWRKTALIVNQALEQCGQRALPISAAVLGARVQALAQSDRLEGQGDLRKRRHSEVRLKR